MAISTGLPQIFPTALGSALTAVEGTGATRLRVVSCSIYVGQSTHTCGAATDGAGTTRTQGGSIMAGTLILATRGSVGQLGSKSKQARAYVRAVVAAVINSRILDGFGGAQC